MSIIDMGIGVPHIYVYLGMRFVMGTQSLQNHIYMTPDAHQIKDLFLCFLKILTLWIRFGAMSQ